MTRRPLRIALAALLLLALLGLGAAFLYRSTGPHFVAAVLTQLWGRRVEMTGFELRAGSTLDVVLRDLRVWPQERADGAPMLEIPKLRGTGLWRRVLAGDLLPLDWRARQPHLRLEIGREGTAFELQEWLAALPDPPRVDLVLRGGALELLRPGAAAMVIERIDVELRRRGLAGALGGTARAEVRVGERRLGAFNADLLLDDALHVRSRLTGLALAELTQGALPSLQGRVSGSLELEQRAGRLGARFDLESRDLRFSPQDFSLPLAPRHARIAGQVTLAESGVELSLEPVALDLLVARGKLEVAFEEPARIRAELRLDPFEPGLPALGRVEPIQILALRFQNWEGIHSRIDAGRVLDGRIDFDLPLAELGEAFAFDRLLAPEELHIQARVEGGVYRPRPGSEPLRDITGSFEIVGNLLRVWEVQMQRGGDQLPELDIEIDGMHRLVHLPPDERRNPDGPGVPIPGLGATFRALRSPDPNGEAEAAATPLVLEVDDAQVGYPAFVLPVRDARARLRFPEDQLVVEEAEGVVGGAPARFDALWDRRLDRVEVRLRYLDGEAPPRRDPGPYWVSGRARAREVRFGGFPIEGFETELRARGANVEFSRLGGALAGGRLESQGNLSLAEREAAPYGFTTRVEAADVLRLDRQLGLDPDTLRGRGTLEGSWTGRLQPGRRFLADTRFEGSADVRDGVLRGLPPTLVLARLPSLQGMRALLGEPLPFGRIHSDFTIEQGVLRSSNFSLIGPELRVLAQGQLDLLDEAHPTDMIVALLFFETVDRMLERVPVVGRWVLGEDQSLVAIYIRFEGPWKDPRATVLPPEAVRNVAGWAGFLLSAGREQLERILSGDLLPNLQSTGR